MTIYRPTVAQEMGGDHSINKAALGKRIIGINEMSNNFTGVALELWPDHNFQQEEAKSRLRLLDLMHKIVGLKSALIKIFAYSVVVEAIGLLLPIGTQLVTDHVIMAHDQSLLSVICIGLIFLPYSARLLACYVHGRR